MTSKKNICIFSSVDWFILSHREDLFLQLSRISEEISVIVFEDTGELAKKYPHVEVIDLSSNRSDTSMFAIFKVVNMVIKSIRRLRIDLVWTVSIKPCFVMLLSERFVRSKVIYTISGLGTLYSTSNFRFGIARFIFEYLVGKSKSKIIVQNYEDQEHFKKIRDFGIYLVQGSGVDLSKYKRVKPNLRVEKVVFVGRTLISKGILDFIWLSEQFKDTDIIFDIYGDSDDNVDSINIRDFDLNKFNRNLTYHGKIDKVEDVLQSASVIVLPSIREGLSLTLCEAAAAGLAILTYDVAGCREVCEHGINGYTSAVHDKIDLANNLRRIINEPDKLSMFSEASMKISKRFDRSSINNELLSILNE